MVLGNPHPPLVSRAVWNIIQSVRRNKRRRITMDEQNKCSGLAVCAVCDIGCVERPREGRPTDSRGRARQKESPEDIALAVSSGDSGRGKVPPLSGQRPRQTIFAFNSAGVNGPACGDAK